MPRKCLPSDNAKACEKWKERLFASNHSKCVGCNVHCILKKVKCEKLQTHSLFSNIHEYQTSWSWANSRTFLCWLCTLPLSHIVFFIKWHRRSINFNFLLADVFVVWSSLDLNVTWNGAGVWWRVYLTTAIVNNLSLNSTERQTRRCAFYTFASFLLHFLYQYKEPIDPLLRLTILHSVNYGRIV